MNLSKWMARIGNARKQANTKKSIEYQLIRVFQEVAEMSEEVRAGGDLTKITYKKDGDGNKKPYGFIPEWADSMSQLLHIADIVGFDPDKALEIGTKYQESKRTKTSKGKSKK